MEKSTFTPLYEHFRARLVAMRKASNMSQRDLAKALGRENSFVSRIELGERRLDLVEIYWVSRACGQDPAKFVAGLMQEFAFLDSQGKLPNKTRKRSRAKG